jgi:transporter family-2 protein
MIERDPVHRIASDPRPDRAGPAHEKADIATPVALGLALLGGVLIATQSRINAQLGADLGQPLVAALVSNSVGLTALTIVFVLRRSTRAALARTLRSGLPWWRYLGGLCGSVLVGGATLIVPTLGVSVFTVGIVAGQTSGGLAVDRAGLGPGGRRPVTGLRVAGGLLALVAVAVSELSHGTGDVTAPWLVVAAAGIGMLSAIQQALNGSLQRVARDAFAPAGVNFVVGTIGLAVAVTVVVIVDGAPLHAWPAHWWLYIGGLLGVGTVLTAVLAVRRLGVLRLGLGTIAGQLTTAVILDIVTPASTRTLTASVVLGVLLTFVAVAIAGWVPRRPAPDRAAH